MDERGVSSAWSYVFGLPGNVHLGLDPAKLWAAWARGRAMSVDLFSGDWSFWDATSASVEDLRQSYRIPPLEPGDADLDDHDVDRNLFKRPGMPLPALSARGVTERPTA